MKRQENLLVNEHFPRVITVKSILTEYGEFIMRNFLSEVKYEHY